jgi:uncharacterized protein YeaO (DUF488 family)
MSSCRRQQRQRRKPASPCLDPGSDASAPATPGLWSDASPSDLRLLRQAIRGDWPIPDERRPPIIAEIAPLFQAEQARAAITVAWMFIEAVKAKVRAEREMQHQVPRVVMQIEGQVNVGHQQVNLNAGNLPTSEASERASRRDRETGTMIKLKRAYEKPSLDDGFRVLVERLWPRCVSEEEARLDLWLKDVAPSTELRRWFGHDPARWREFQQRYRAELKDKKDALKLLREKSRAGTVTLVYAARDEEHNGALVLKNALKSGKRR